MQGWECPKCGNVYAPYVTTCLSCSEMAPKRPSPYSPQPPPWSPYIPPRLWPQSDCHGFEPPERFVTVTPELLADS